MASINLIACDGCGNILVPGDTVSLVTKGVLAGSSEAELVIFEDEGTEAITLCEDCANGTARLINGLIEDRMNRDLRVACCGPDDACADECGSTD